MTQTVPALLNIFLGLIKSLTSNKITQKQSMIKLKDICTFDPCEEQK